MAKKGTCKPFFENVRITESCWEWTASLRPNGYGQMRHPQTGRTTKAHRFAWESAYGPIPDGLHVCHHCDNRKCVRIDHLFLGTRSDDMTDCSRKGRHANGAKTHCPRGHEYNEVNTLRAPNGRQCKECRNSRRRVGYVAS